MDIHKDETGASGTKDFDGIALPFIDIAQYILNLWNIIL